MTVTTATPRANFKRPKVAANMIGVSVSTLRRWAKEGRIIHFQLETGEFRFNVDEYLGRQRIVPVGPKPPNRRPNSGFARGYPQDRKND